MHLHELDLNLLPVLQALLDKGSVSRAADALGLTQSAVSHALRRLREYFNDPLFVRSGGRFVPTPKATELAPHVAHIMERLHADLVPGAAFDASQTRRTFVLNMTDMAELVFLPRFLPEFRERAPGASLRVVRLMPADIAHALEQRRVDLAISSLPLTREGLFQQQLIEHPLVCMVASRRKGIKDGRITLDAYQAASHIGIKPFGGEDDIFEWALQSHGGPKRRFLLSTPGFMTLPMLIAGSDLVATVPAHMAEVFAHWSGVRCVQPPLDLPALPLRQTWHPRFQNDPGNQWVRHLFHEIFCA
ncbi:LysR family transcriptional regulator [Hydrogenophaga sp. 5NK40-0174]|uniref:LysR family transcriptional regulator n=1 Tax=Hydrogenophaga sp. 5NK40-0174 TaxID=3127649 RepID=UPI00310C66F1